jgi:hypothetical protein
MAWRKYDHDKVERLYLQGVGWEAIAAEIGCEKTLVNYVRIKRVLPRRQGISGGRTRVYDYDLIIARYASGATTRVIAGELGCDQSLVNYVIRKYGNPRPKPPKKAKPFKASLLSAVAPRVASREADERWRALLALPSGLR